MLDVVVLAGEVAAPDQLLEHFRGGWGGFKKIKTFLQLGSSQKRN